MARKTLVGSHTGPYGEKVPAKRTSRVLRFGNRAVHRLSCGCCDRLLELVEGRWVRKGTLTKSPWVLFWLKTGPTISYRLVESSSNKTPAG